MKRECQLQGFCIYVVQVCIHIVVTLLLDSSESICEKGHQRKFIMNSTNSGRRGEWGT